MKDTKKEKVKNHLLSGRTITPKEAYHLYGSMRLGAIIYELKREGMKIIDISDEINKNRQKGNKINYSVYKYDEKKI